MTDVDDLIERVRVGDEAAKREIIALAHGELRGLAGQVMRNQPAHHTLQLTALVSEACVKLLGGRAEWNDREHFLRIAASAMRHVLVDYARARNTARRKPKGKREDIDVLVGCFEARSGSLAALDGALERLRHRDSEAAQLVELRFFGGATVIECASILGISTRQVQRRWNHARAILRLELEFDPIDSDHGSAPPEQR